jgi:histidinol-phosphate aminotransferase
MLSAKGHIQKIKPAVHGGLGYTELASLGIDPGDVIDFSVSTNPAGPPAGLRRALSRVDLESYPDSDSILLKKKLAESLGCQAENLIVGNGSTELIRLAAQAYLGPGDLALIVKPTYGEYEEAVQMVGAECVYLRAKEDNDFRLNGEEIEKAISRRLPAAIFLCNPNNPTGQYLDQETIEKVVRKAADSLIVLDEAYIGFVEKVWPALYLLKYPNVLVIRSMTKDYAIAGIRLGYACANQRLIETLNRVKPPWNVSALAQTAGLFVLDKQGYLEKMRQSLKKTGGYLKRNLIKLGYQPLPSEANFILLKVGQGAALRRSLMQKGILVRDCASFGLPQYIRLAFRNQSDCRLLVKTLGQMEGLKNDS